MSTSRTKPTPCPKCGAKRTMLNGEFFRERRQRSGVTLCEMARRMDVSPAYVSDMERGLRTFLPQYAAKYEGR